MTASVLARQSEIPLFTVRHYTRVGLLKPSRRPSNGYKEYRQSDVTRLRFIVAAKKLGFTLAEVAEILGKAQHGESPCPTVREIVARRVEENRCKIEELKQLQKKMRRALDEWSVMSDATPNGESVCHLIESVAETKKVA